VGKIYDFRLKSLVSEVTTDYTTDYTLALDHVYTDIPADKIQRYVAESYFSHHKPVIVTVYSFQPALKKFE